MTEVLDTVPEDFADAYGGLLLELARRISRAEVSKEIPQEVLGEKVDEWKHADCRGCRGAATLAEAPIKALQYELASRGPKEGAEAVEKKLQALSRVESALVPPEAARESGKDTETAIVEAALPEAFREAHPQARGFRMGEFQIIFETFVGPPHAHLSISHPSRYTTFEEIWRAARAPSETHPNLWALVPMPADQPLTARKTVNLYVLPPENLLGRGKA